LRREFSRHHGRIEPRNDERSSHAAQHTTSSHPAERSAPLHQHDETPEGERSEPCDDRGPAACSYRSESDDDFKAVPSKATPRR
jgi:hypothetical protein